MKQEPSRYREIEILMETVRDRQKDAADAAAVVRDGLKQIVEAMKRLDASVVSASAGSVSIERPSDAVSSSVWRDCATDEGFVASLDSIRRQKSALVRLQLYRRLLMGLAEARKSVKSKVDKLTERAEYLRKAKNFGSDYVGTQRLKDRTEASLATLDRRVELACDRFFACRVAVLDAVGQLTVSAVRYAGNKGAVRRAMLRNDDSGIVNAMSALSEKVKKETEDE